MRNDTGSKGTSGELVPSVRITYSSAMERARLQHHILDIHIWTILLLGSVLQMLFYPDRLCADEIPV